jgi:hypothetical protein
LAKYGTEGKTARQKGAQKRKSTPRTRSQGLRLMEYWVRNPRLRAAIREEAALLALTSEQCRHRRLDRRGYR